MVCAMALKNYVFNHCCAITYSKKTYEYIAVVAIRTQVHFQVWGNCQYQAYFSVWDDYRDQTLCGIALYQTSCVSVLMYGER